MRVESSAMAGDDDVYIDAARRKAERERKKKEAADERAQQAVEAVMSAVGADMVDGKRKASQKIVKNKGLTKYRRSDLKYVLLIRLVVAEFHGCNSPLTELPVHAKGIATRRLSSAGVARCLTCVLMLATTWVKLLVSGKRSPGVAKLLDKQGAITRESPSVLVFCERMCISEVIHTNVFFISH